MSKKTKKRPKIIYRFQATKEINPHFYRVWKTSQPYNILKGGRNSFKSSVISLMLVFMMISQIRKGNIANVAILRKVASHIRDSVFKQIEWAIDKMGLSDQFRSSVTPFKITHKKSGSAFYFYGQDDVQKLKGNAVDNFIAVWYEESTEFDGKEDFDQNFATFARQKSPHVDHMKFFWSYNPPRNPYNWMNEWVEELRERPDYLIHESSYLDDALGFTEPQVLDEIQRIKENDFDYYRYLYLGEPVGLGTNVYNFELFKKIKEVPAGEHIMSISYGLDTGHQQSATALVCVGMTNKGNVIVLDTAYYDPSDKARKLAPDEIAHMIHKFETRTSKQYGRGVYKRTIDSAEGAIRNQYYKDYDIRWNPVNKKKQVTMVENVVTLLAQGRVYYLDTPGNKVFEDQHKNYRWDEKTIRSDNPKAIEVDDHVPDAFKYFVNDNLRELDLIF